MKFTNLMLLHTVPLYWEPRPLFHAERLQDFLLFLLDPGKPGWAALGIPTTADWLKDGEATAWVKRAYEEVWHPGSLRLSQLGKDINEWVFNELFTKNKAELFLDRQRFEACLPDLPPEASLLSEAALGKLAAYRGNLYLGLSVDWSFAGNTILWTPQLRISNFVPSYSRIAPAPPADYVAPKPMEAQAAADILENHFWHVVEKLFRAVRYQFDLGEAGRRLDGRSLEPAVFYYAEPELPPPCPEDYLSTTAGLPDLVRLSRVTLGTDDPASSDVAGAVLEGNIFTLRREIVRREVARAYYLLVPWYAGDRAAHIKEVEREATFVADKWTFVEFTLGYGAYDVTTDLAMPAEQMALWEDTLDTAARLASRLHDMVAYQPTRGVQKKEAFTLVNQLRLLLARLQAQMLSVTSDVMATADKWKASLENTKAFAERAFTSRPLPNVRDLIKAVPDFSWCRYSGERASLAANRAERLRRTYEATDRALQDLAEQEQREDREREEQFREQLREREERQQRILGYALALLAAISAFPLLVGQLDWGDLQTAMGGWPGFLGPVKNLLESLHPYLVLIGLISASVVIPFLVCMVGRIYFRARRKPEQPPRDPDEFQKTGRRIVCVWQLVDTCRSAVRRLRELAFVSHVTPGRTPAQEETELRWQIDASDRRACDELAAVWDWLAKTENPMDASEPLEFESLRLLVHRSIIATELLNNRPVPFPLPLGICLFRHKSPDLVASSVVSDFEFEQVLNGYGFEDDEVKAIDAWAEQPLAAIPPYAGHPLAAAGKRLKDLPIREFTQAMRDVVGVSALHTRPIQPPRE